MKFGGFCDFPLDDRLVLVEASTKAEARQKIKALVSAIEGCSIDQVSLYNCFSELENPQLVLSFESGHCGHKAIAWEDNPLILFSDENRKAAYHRYYLAMEDKAAFEAERALSSLKNK
jgi:hypothetical protein